MSKEQWINEVYECLCKSKGAPVNETERQNLREWAEALAGDEGGFFQDGMTPQEAHDEEMSHCGE